MIDIRVEVKKNEAPQMLRDIDGEVKKLIVGVRTLGDATAAKLKENIQIPTQRGGVAKELADKIKVYRFWEGDTFYVGIGKISELPKWTFVFEYGGYTPLETVSYGTLGYFGNGDSPDSSLAGTGKGTQKWTHTGNVKDFYMKPKHPIKPHRYLYHTVLWLRHIWSDYWRKNTLIPIKGLPFIKTTPDIFGKGYLWKR